MKSTEAVKASLLQRTTSLATLQADEGGSRAAPGSAGGVRQRRRATPQGFRAKSRHITGLPFAALCVCSVLSTSHISRFVAGSTSTHEDPFCIAAPQHLPK